MNAVDNGAAPLAQSRHIPEEITKTSQFVNPEAGSGV
jgi:hypothetical protein